MMPFKVGYCECGQQTMVRDRFNRPVSGLIGTKVIWLCLVDDDDVVQTRIGTLQICKDCDISKIKCEDLITWLKSSSYSGFGDPHELKRFPKMKIELVKTFGD